MKNEDRPVGQPSAGEQKVTALEIRYKYLGSTLQWQSMYVGEVGGRCVGRAIRAYISSKRFLLYPLGNLNKERVTLYSVRKSEHVTCPNPYYSALR